MYVATANARLSCSEFLVSEEAQVGAMIRDTLTKRLKLIRTIDRVFKIDTRLFFSSIGSNSEGRLSAPILPCLPGPGEDDLKTARESLDMFDAVPNGKIFAFRGAWLQSAFICARGATPSASLRTVARGSALKRTLRS